MLGIKDPWIAAPYILCILSALLCVVWGVMKWNKGDEDEPEKEIRHWAAEEDRIEEDL